jgi:hypothetical protein
MKYVALYKALMLVQKRLNGGKPRNFDTFVAGLIGGYVVFGNRNAINEQVMPIRSIPIIYKTKLMLDVRPLDRVVRMFASGCDSLASVCSIRIVPRHSRQAYSSGFALLLCLCRSRMGRSHVVV